MDLSILGSLTDPPILFFFLGLFVAAVRSNLEIPAPVTKFLSLYLLMAIGFKGGQALRETGLTGRAAAVIGIALLLALVIPALGFLVLRRRVNEFDAAAIAATYGSVSAVTFIAATQFVTARGEEPGGYMTVALVLMESPAIIMAVLLATWARSRQRSAQMAGDVAGAGASGPASGAPLSMRAILHEAFTDGAHLLLIGSLVIGTMVGADAGEAMSPFVNDMFKGLLAFFLLEMGLLVARQLREVRDVGPFLIGFGIVMPLIGASMALALGALAGLPVGDLTMLAVLAASGSYIVVPAVVRYAIPEARPSRYFTMALAVTFPFNIVLGIPLYYTVAQHLGA
ncbi:MULTISPECIES: sodium-dependent bicarbonate transport family permease [Dietzia]|uniref:sodium-dependent bicarbonate transport family permease n=1 Tax=Dietzia TaxID=37914 RepID=UPI000380CF49|nr:MULTISPECIES: sodium-dependent bicarbonate transport family permease [Dietzia]EYT62006.1 permease [Dietzia sp. UCD-THP]MBB1033119.1 sodium-dependent bicarbonate transport family permease [Dietzia sp. CQ4]MBB1037689.1 sodium-dependent bicarbonate transport family permease [Dietzia natronolimnaea]MCT1515102.1 sodium-dependent bicarbonate transport family permease [Dietzia cercidiphylli]